MERKTFRVIVYTRMPSREFEYAFEEVRCQTDASRAGAATGPLIGRVAGRPMAAATQRCHAIPGMPIDDRTSKSPTSMACLCTLSFGLGTHVEALMPARSRAGSQNVRAPQPQPRCSQRPSPNSYSPPTPSPRPRIAHATMRRAILPVAPRCAAANPNAFCTH